MCNHEHTRYKYLKQNNNRLILSVRCSGILTIIRLHLIGWFMVFNAPFNNISAISRSVCIWKTIWKYQSCKNKMTVQRKYITMTTWRCGAIFWLSTCLVNVIPEARRAPTLDIYVYLTIAVSLSLLVDYWTPRVSSDHESVLRHWHCLLDFTSRFIFFGWLAPKYYELTWWKVLQKRIVRSKLDIYFFLSYQQNVKFVFFSAAVALFNGILYVYLLC